MYVAARGLMNISDVLKKSLIFVFGEFFNISSLF